MAKRVIHDMTKNAELALSKKEETASVNIPAGYISIELSTHGKYGAPEIFHIRNFDVKDIVDLSLSEQEQLPDKVADMLDDLILENEVTVRDWHESEVIELLVILFKNFYSNRLENVDYQYSEEELTKLPEDLKQDIKAKIWVPKTTIDLDSVSVYEDENVYNKVSIKNPKNGLEASFTYPRFGDILIIRQFILEYFDKKEKQFESVKSIIKFRREAEERLAKGEDINLARIPQAPKVEIDKYREFELEKALFSIDAIRALHLMEWEGQTVSHLPLNERIKIIKDPRLDITITKKIEKHFKQLKIGVKPEVSMYNPFTKEEETKPYSFRLLDILSAIQLFESDDDDVSIELTYE